MNTVRHRSVLHGRETERTLEPIPVSPTRSIPSGWKRLHGVAVTLDSESLPKYAGEFFRDCFGASACQEDADGAHARCTVGTIERPMPVLLTRPMVQLRPGRARLSGHSAVRGTARKRRRIASPALAEAEETRGGPTPKGTTGPPIEWAYTGLPGADPKVPAYGDNGGSRPPTRHGPVSGRQPEYRPRSRGSGTTDRWVFGSCSTEYSFECEKEYLPRATGDPPWADPPVPRRRRMDQVLSRQREGPIGPAWVKSAYVITNDDGRITRRAAWQGPPPDDTGPKGTDESSGQRDGFVKRRYRVVARRLKKGAATAAGQRTVDRKRPRSARDGPPITEGSA